MIMLTIKICPQCQAVVATTRLKVCKPMNMCVEPSRHLPDQANCEQTVHRREHDKKHKASITASETIVQYCAEGFTLQCSSYVLGSSYLDAFTSQPPPPPPPPPHMRQHHNILEAVIQYSCSFTVIQFT